LNDWALPLARARNPMVALFPGLFKGSYRTSSGSLAMLAAILRASSVSSFAADLPRPFHPAQFHVRSARREIFY